MLKQGSLLSPLSAAADFGPSQDHVANGSPLEAEKRFVANLLERVANQRGLNVPIREHFAERLVEGVVQLRNSRFVVLVERRREAVGQLVMVQDGAATG